MKVLKQGRLNKIWSATNDCYDQACRKLGYSIQDIRAQVLDWEITEQEFQEKKEKLDQVYRELLLKLPAKILEDMIIAAGTGQQRRAQTTINAAAIELLERELRDDEEKSNPST